MSQPIILVTFYSRCGSTEKLALAAAVGAVQSRALIRLRRAPDVSAAKTLEEFPECKESLVRMHREYVAPTEADILGADAIIFASPTNFNPSSAEWSDYLQLLTELQSQGKLRGKVGAAVDAGSESTLQSFLTVIIRLGLNVAGSNSPAPDPVERAMALGREVAEVARQKTTER